MRDAGNRVLLMDGMVLKRRNTSMKHSEKKFSADARSGVSLKRAKKCS